LSSKPSLKVKVYATVTCAVCDAVCNGIKALGWPHEILDGFAAENDAYLDSMGVDKLPFVQLIDDEGNVAWQKSGDDNVSLKEIVNQYETQSTTRRCGKPS
jgi:hypothetical protein